MNHSKARTEEMDRTLTPKGSMEKMRKEKAKSNVVISSRKQKKDATKVNSAQDTTGC